MKMVQADVSEIYLENFAPITWTVKLNFAPVPYKHSDTWKVKWHLDFIYIVPLSYFLAIMIYYSYYWSVLSPSFIVNFC